MGYFSKNLFYALCKNGHWADEDGLNRVVLKDIPSVVYHNSEIFKTTKTSVVKPQLLGDYAFSYEETLCSIEKPVRPIRVDFDANINKSDVTSIEVKCVDTGVVAISSSLQEWPYCFETPYSPKSPIVSIISKEGKKYTTEKTSNNPHTSSYLVTKEG